MIKAETVRKLVERSQRKTIPEIQNVTVGAPRYVREAIGKKIIGLLVRHSIHWLPKTWKHSRPILFSTELPLVIKRGQLVLSGEDAENSRFNLLAMEHAKWIYPQVDSHQHGAYPLFDKAVRDQFSRLVCKETGKPFKDITINDAIFSPIFLSKQFISTTFTPNILQRVTDENINAHTHPERSLPSGIDLKIIVQRARGKGHRLQTGAPETPSSRKTDESGEKHGGFVFVNNTKAILKTLNENPELKPSQANKKRIAEQLADDARGKIIGFEYRFHPETSEITLHPITLGKPAEENGSEELPLKKVFVKNYIRRRQSFNFSDIKRSLTKERPDNEAEWENLARILRIAMGSNGKKGGKYERLFELMKGQYEVNGKASFHMMDVLGSTRDPRAAGMVIDYAKRLLNPKSEETRALLGKNEAMQEAKLHFEKVKTTLEHMTALLDAAPDDGQLRGKLSGAAEDLLKAVKKWKYPGSYESKDNLLRVHFEDAYRQITGKKIYLTRMLGRSRAQPASIGEREERCRETLKKATR